MHKSLIYGVISLVSIFAIAIVMTVYLNSQITQVITQPLSLHMSTEELVKQADFVARGKVTKMHNPTWSNKDLSLTNKAGEVMPNIIGNYIDVSIIKVFKGVHEAENISIWNLGGKIGQAVHETVGAPAFTEGEEVLFFLNAYNPDCPAFDPMAYGLEGITQGAYSIKIDPIDGQLRAQVLPSKFVLVETLEELISSQGTTDKKVAFN